MENPLQNIFFSYFFRIDSYFELFYASTYIKCESQSSFSNKNSKIFEFFSELIMAVENDEIDVPEEAKNSLEVTPKLAEAFPEAITLSEALNCRICRSHIKTPMLTKCKTLFKRERSSTRF